MRQKYRKSPLAPKKANKVSSIQGIELYTYCANLYDKSRNDVAIFIFKEKGSIAEVFTQSSMRSCTLDWNEKALKKKEVQAIIINSGNANTFTGKKGHQSLIKISELVSNIFNVSKSKIFFASTGVIGEEFPEQKIINAIRKNKIKNNNWMDAAKAIMTTDTFPKAISSKTKVDNKVVTITGITKGSGMIEPNMATMLGFIFIDLEIPQKILQALLKQLNAKSFNRISVDGDESTNDTVILASSNKIKLKNKINSINDKRINSLKISLYKVFSSLSEQIVRDGEGATKLIKIKVKKAKNILQAEKIARSIANSNLFKTAIYGEDANWGRIIMAIGKTYEKINQSKLKIYFGNYLVAMNGKANTKINNSDIKKYLSQKEVEIQIDLAIGNSHADTLTCDLSHKYIDINASYKS